MSFRFDPVEHKYWYAGENVTGVSEALAPIVDFSMVPEERLAFARDRGTAVHKAVYLDNRGDLDEDTVDREHVLPYLRAWRKFMHEHRPQILMSERPLFHDALRFAGTPDVVATVGKHNVVIDIKTVASLSPVVGVQLSAYEMLVTRNTRRAIHARWAVQLKSDGSYRVKTYADETATFVSLLTLNNWRKRHG